MSVGRMHGSFGLCCINFIPCRHIFIVIVVKARNLILDIVLCTKGHHTAQGMASKESRKDQKNNGGMRYNDPKRHECEVMDVA